MNQSVAWLVVAALLHKPLEQAPVLRAVQQIFRVPLHTQPLAFLLGFNGLHKAIKVTGHNSNALAQFIDGLVMQAVDPQAAGTGYRRQATAGPQGCCFSRQYCAPVRG